MWKQATIIKPGQEVKKPFRLVKCGQERARAIIWAEDEDKAWDIACQNYIKNNEDYDDFEVYEKEA